MLINCAAYNQGKKIADMPYEEISDYLATPENFVWVGTHDPSPTLLNKLQEEFGLHELAIEDTGRGKQRPKLEEYGSTLFIVLHTLELKDEKNTDRRNELITGETHIYVNERFILSVRRRNQTSYAHVRSRCEQQPELMKYGASFVLYALMDFIVDQYFPILTILEDELEQIEEKIFRRASMRAAVQQLYATKRKLMRVRRAVMPLTELGSRLLSNRQLVIQDAVRPYYRDVFDHIHHISERIEAMREMLTTAMQVNLSLVTVGEAEVTKKLASWGAIIAVPTMFGGIYGMNFKYMPELEWGFGYPLVMAFMAGLCGYLYYRFKKTGWL